MENATDMADMTNMTGMTDPSEMNGMSADEIPNSQTAQDGNAMGTDSAKLAEFIGSELRKLISAYPDSGITSLKDLLNKPYAKELMRYWSRGIPLYKAYGIVNAEEIYAKRAAAEKQAALNTLRSKSHLVSTGGASRADKSVPMEVMEQYREFFPDWNDSQIISDYRRRY